MKAPKCRICHEEHWGSICTKHGGRSAKVIEGIDPITIFVRAVIQPTVKANAPKTIEAKKSPARPTKGRPATGYDKKAADRERARARRAAKNAKNAKP